MATIVTRSGKGSPLTNNEVDANFTNLNTELGTKVNASSLAAVATSGAYADLSGRPTNVSSFTNDSGYLTSFTEADPTVPSHVKAITTTNISNWNTAFGWGNHASAGYLTGITSGQITTALGFTPATAAQGAKADTAVQTITSTDGSISITGTTAIDLSVAVAGSTSNVLLPVRNTTGATLTKGTAVYISGATGQISTVSKAIATSDATSAQTLGLVTANISNNSNGNVTLIGAITNINTSAYTDGQQLYLSPTTAGTLTATKPHAPDHLVYMAVVEHAHPTQGKLFVKVQNGYEMDELHDVSAQNPANNDGLFYNTTSGLWEKKSIATALGYTPVNKAGDTLTGPITVNSGANQVILGSDGAIELTRGAGGAYIDFKDSTAEDFDVRLQATGNQLGIAAAGGLTLNGAGVLTGITSGQVITALGYTPYNATNPNGYITSSALSAYLPLTGGSLNVGGVSNTHQFLYNESGGEIQLIDSTGAGPILIDNVSGLARFYKVGSGAMSIGTTGANYLQFITNGSERFRIDSSGNVGIGTSAPSSLLHVKRGSNATEVYPSGTWASRIINATDASGENGLVVGNRWAASSSTVFEVGSIFGGGGGSWYSYYKVDGSGNSIWGSGGTEVMRLAGSNLGIGTTSPSAVLHLNKASGAADLRLSVGGTLYTNIYASSSDVNILSITAIPLILGTNNTERMRIDSSGNVGIGASAPATKLEVNGGLIAGSENRQTHPPTGPVGFKAQWNFTGGDGETDFYNLYAPATTSFRFYQTTGSGTAQLLYNMRPSSHEFYTGGTERFRINSTGGITSSDLSDAVGYKGLPQNQRTGAYTLAISDIGKHLYVTAGAFAVTIPADATLNFPVGAAITFVCEDAGKTIVPASGVALVLAGTGAATTGTRTLAIGAVATLIKVQANRWYISGSGVT
jgi:hypothetical protein